MKLLLDRVQQDYQNTSIKILCDNDRVIYFPEATRLETCMKFLWTSRLSEVFMDYWRQHVKTFDCQLTMKDVHKELWLPVFSKCERVLEQLQNFSIPLTIVDELFKGKKASTIESHIQQLQEIVTLCKNGEEVQNFEWIKFVLERMEQYWILCKYEKAAKAFLELKNVLKLTGDFSLVENVVSQVLTIQYYFLYSILSTNSML